MTGIGIKKGVPGEPGYPGIPGLQGSSGLPGVYDPNLDEEGGNGAEGIQGPLGMSYLGKVMKYFM